MQRSGHSLLFVSNRHSSVTPLASPTVQFNFDIDYKPPLKSALKKPYIQSDLNSPSHGKTVRFESKFSKAFNGDQEGCPRFRLLLQVLTSLSLFMTGLLSWINGKPSWALGAWAICVLLYCNVMGKVCRPSKTSSITKIRKQLLGV